LHPSVDTVSRRGLLIGGAVAGLGLALARAGGVSAQDAPFSSQPTATPLGDAVPPEVADNPNDWAVWNGNYAGTRAAANSSITAANLDSLSTAWSVPLDATAGYGAITSPVLVIGDRIYYQDTEANTFAIARDTGEQIWEKRYDSSNVGPNGIAVGYGMVFGGIGPTRESYALNADTGEEIWRTVLSQNPRESITGAPTVYDSIVYISTTPSYQGGDRGIIFAQDASNGEVLWTWDTTGDNLWGQAAHNSGGGVWYPITFDDDGHLYFGTGNPAPFPDNNAVSRPGDNLYSSSMVALDPSDGSTLWYYQDKPHDLNDHDFQNSPVIAMVERGDETIKVAIGSGKTGNVVAVLADSGSLLWKVPVGTHTEYGDGLDLPSTPVVVYPGTGGGVQVPIAYAENTVYVGVNEQPSTMQSNGDSFSGSTPYDQATGLVLALDAITGSEKWSVSLPSEPTGAVTVCNDVVFVGTLSGQLLALSTENGDQLWSQEFDAGFNAPPSIAGDTIYLPLGGPKILPAASDATPAPETDGAAPPSTAGTTAQIIALKVS
jgi:outer membrane protein assembly factor BamB